MLGISISGRMNRGAYAQRLLLIMVVSVALNFMAGPFQTPELVLLLIIVASLYMTVYHIGIAARRLHDLGKSGWWQLLSLIPFVNLAFALYLLFFKGEEGENRFGPDPLAENGSGAVGNN